MTNINIELPDSFYNEEVRNGYTISQKMKKVWAVELDLFQQLDKICKKYGLTYYADGGTLLGTIRHKGFIPWDDDMDFIMYRSDFEKLCRVASELKEPYFFQTEETDPGSLRCHGQLRNSSTTGIIRSEEKKKYPFNQGIFIDIFPIDTVPEDKEERDKFFKRLSYLKMKARVYYDHINGYNEIKKVVGVKTFLKKCHSMIGQSYYEGLHLIYSKKNPYYEKYKREVVKYNNSSSKFVMDLACGAQKDLLYKADIATPIYLPFENFNMPVPQNYNRFLTTLYGDWHVMVKGLNLHGSCIFDTENSYKNYIRKLQ
jgi:lipopolysaccharide cholinephosphotransferase